MVDYKVSGPCPGFAYPRVDPNRNSVCGIVLETYPRLCERDPVIKIRKGDVVLVKGKWVKQINAIYVDGRLAFRRVKGEPAAARPKDCRSLARKQTILWEKASANSRFMKTSYATQGF